MTRPDYGIDAPGVVRNLFIAMIAGCALYLSARSGLWSGAIAHVDLSRAGLFAGLGLTTSATTRRPSNDEA